MNYRHAYHAGNFADVMKHLALTLILRHLQQKETPFFVLDAHGGTGLYALDGEESGKTGEWLEGIGRFKASDTMPEDFRPYFDFIQSHLQQNLYPGSPLIIRHFLRPQDRMIANELHPEDHRRLAALLTKQAAVQTRHMDAYECIRAHVPPPEKRGAILIDPPFEKTDEFQTLCKQMTAWKKRFERGIFMIWYPVKPHLGVRDLGEAARALNIPRTWQVETLKHPRAAEGVFNGCGLIIFNAPYQMPEKMTAMLPFLKERMGLHETYQQWLSAP